MSTELLERVGRHAVAETGTVSRGLILGERADFRGTTELARIDKIVNDPSPGFSYGQHFDSWGDEERLVGAEGYVYGSIGARRVATFFGEVNKLGSQRWSDRAVTAVEAILDVVDSPEDTEAIALEVSFDEWDRESSALTLFRGWLRQLVDAYDEPGDEQTHIVRDDANDPLAVQFGKHASAMWLGSGRVPVIVFEESAVRYDDNANRYLVRQIWIAKRRTPEGALQLANRPTLIEWGWMARALDEAIPSVTPEEREHILTYADRSTAQTDEDIHAWLDWYRYPPSQRWRRTRRVAGAIINAMADSRPLRWLERKTRRVNKA